VIAASIISSISPTADQARITMANLLDERIDQYQSIDWTLVCREVHHIETAFDWGAGRYPVGDMP
jgi:hypothetical protein